LVRDIILNTIFTVSTTMLIKQQRARGGVTHMLDSWGHIRLYLLGHPIFKWAKCPRRGPTSAIGVAYKTHLTKRSLVNCRLPITWGQGGWPLPLTLKTLMISLPRPSPWTFIRGPSARTFIWGLLPRISVRGPRPTGLCLGPLSMDLRSRPSWPSHDTSPEWPSLASLHQGTLTSQPCSGRLSQHWRPPCTARTNFFESEGLNLREDPGKVRSSGQRYDLGFRSPVYKISISCFFWQTITTCISNTNVSCRHQNVVLQEHTTWLSILV
jgi:hypothetical protein